MKTICPQTEYISEAGMFHGSIPFVMGTRFDMVAICARETGQEAWDGVCSLLTDLWQMFDRFDPQSEVSKVNATAALAPVEVSETMTEALNMCKVYHEKTLGLFDVTKIDFSKVRIEGNSVSFGAQNLSLDFGGFAKGYAVSKVRSLLQNLGIADAYVDFGGSTIYGMGHHPYGDCWKVSLQNPFNGESIGEFSLRDSCLSTSGNTPGYDGHIINPLKGVKITGKAASTVITSDPLDAEVLSTVWMIADAQGRLAIREKFEDVMASVYDL